ncbi:MAG: class I SAM-dependent methyltransferase [Betaproteobacteria bacterium]
MELKGYLNSLIYRISVCFLRLRVFVQDKLGLTKSYQPNPFLLAESQSRSWRESSDRFDAISHSLPQEALSCLDVGCNEGYFIFKMAERGGFCLGVDAGRNEIMVADALAKIHKINNVSFINASVDPESALRFPKFDVVIFLSVFHHLARHNGLDHAKATLASLSAVCNKYMIFETGQPNETGVSWADSLDFMLPDIKEWCANLLLESGFREVVVVGEHPAVYCDVPRYLFLATK